MEQDRFLTVTAIKGAFKIRNGYPAGTVKSYSGNGLPGYELVYRTYGEVHTEFDNAVLSHTKDTIQFLPKGGGQHYFVTTIDPGECIDIYFDTDLPLFDRPICFSGSAELRSLFIKCSKLWLDKKEGYRYQAMILMYQILDQITMQQSPQKKPRFQPHYRKIQPGVEYLNEHFCEEKANFHALAKQCNMSYSYFRRLFEQCMGVPPAKYVIQKKLAYAKELFASGHYRVSDVAQITGFSDVYYFSRVFKAQLHLTPTEFLEKYRASK